MSSMVTASTRRIDLILIRCPDRLRDDGCAAGSEQTQVPGASAGECPALPSALARDRLQHADAIALGIGEVHIHSNAGNLNGLAMYRSAGARHAMHRRRDVFYGDYDV